VKNFPNRLTVAEVIAESSAACFLKHNEHIQLLSLVFNILNVLQQHQV